ncbi:hypothetical protein [Rhizobacter sp. OV335]|jgi:hypothetical protein|uniref:hypothetical protein n=1 Tax=Rhizobacter sp. OV335 TaxID=1500264 RepID=UPI00091CE44C|nr:hypothetical protein [Rhizobacter sp. OV335]SHN33152.1 hypothetical protein SAMN02787076_05232 [Rhizobacter sp. OV335]
MKTTTPATAVPDEAREISLYTIILEFGGGTYVSQTRAPSKESALSSWCKTIRIDKDFGPDSYRLAEEIEHEADAARLSLLDGLESAWSFTTVLNDRLILGHVIKTVPPPA